MRNFDDDAGENAISNKTIKINYSSSAKFAIQ